MATTWGIKPRTGATLFGGALASLAMDLATHIWPDLRFTVPQVANITLVICTLCSYFSPVEVPDQVVPPTPPPLPVRSLADMPTEKKL